MYMIVHVNILHQTSLCELHKLRKVGLNLLQGHFHSKSQYTHV